MQKLQFESAWDKTIAPQDRKQVIDAFQQITTDTKKGVFITFLWKAENHKNELLVTALIHNYDDTSLQMNHTVIAYQIEQENIITNTFNVKPVIPGNTSMPWTFIFSSLNETTQKPQYTILNTL